MKVDLIDSMGSDLTVVNSARVSFNKESDWDFEYDDGLSSRDKGLIEYLARNNHWTPFSHVMITMREKVPIFVARQRFKHMVGFTYNEVSRRYVDDEPEFYYPRWRGRPDGNIKQGSGREFDEVDAIHVNEAYKEFVRRAKKIYDDMIYFGVAPEQARMVLPQSMYTEYIVTGSLAAWARAWKLRSDNHSQKEIQELAQMWDGIISNLPELKYSWAVLKK